MRAIDQLRREKAREVDDISDDFVDETTPLPDEEALGHIEADQLHRAMTRLSVSQRKALSLYYFEEQTTRQAAESLGWSEPTFRRRRDAAIRTLRERLGVSVPEFDIGLAAWLSLTATDSRLTTIGSNLAGMAETVRSGAMVAIDRGRDFTTRLFSTSGGETAIGIGSPASKAAAGVCATAIAACTATGVIGPGVGGVDLIEHTKPKPSIEKRVEPTRPETSRPPAASTASAANPESASASDSRKAERQEANASNRGKSGSGQKRTRKARQSATSQFGVESSASTIPAESVPSVTSPPPSAPSPSPSPDQAAQQQFGLP